MLHTRTLQITILAILAILTLILDASTRIYAQLQRTPITALYPQHQDLCVISSYAVTWYEDGKKDEDYQGIYFDRKKVQYYSVTNIQETNNIFFSYNPKKQEKVFWKESGYAKFEKKLLYVGNVSQLERVYVDTNDNKQYIKTLIPIKDKYTRFLGKLLPVKGKFYPKIHERYGIIFINKNYPERIFWRSYTSYEGSYDESWGLGMLKMIATDEELNKYLEDKEKEECGEDGSRCEQL